MLEHAILWRRLDAPGHDSCSLQPYAAGWQLVGTAVFAEDGAPCRLDYRVLCDASWRSVAARVVGWHGTREIDLALSADGDGRWRLNGVDVPEVAGCLDVDLSFTPATNLLPIRRLGLSSGAAADVRAAWLDFPSLELAPLDQSYRRLGPNAWRYESAGGSFVRELAVDDAGFVVTYPGLWERVA